MNSNQLTQQHQRNAQKHAVTPPKPKHRWFWLLTAAALGICCVLAAATGLGYYFLNPKVNEVPIVLLLSPQPGDQINVGDDVLIRSTARDEQKINRVELWVDGKLLKSETTNVPGGISPFPLLGDWQPSAPGDHTLTVRAYNTKGGRNHASINVQAVEVIDRDGDSVSDDADGCPDEPGSEIALGCLDRDNDGIPDSVDACPDQAGTVEASGCPAPVEGDIDGDGILDGTDACAEAPGILLAEGCPDSDGDGVIDTGDACPTEPGWEDHEGCPVPGDLDADAVADADDACPEEWGFPELSGCPEVIADGGEAVGGDTDEGSSPDAGGVDSDGDGAADGTDPCPAEAGLPEDDYCPAPEGVGGSEGEAPAIEIPGFFLGEFHRYVPLEIQAVEFSVEEGRNYDHVWCYVRPGDGDVQRYEFESLGENYWNVAEVLGGANSITMMVPADEIFHLYMNCGAENITLGAEGGEGTVFDLGQGEHHPGFNEWDSSILEMHSNGLHGHEFLLKYRLCTPSCEESPFPPPMLSLFFVGDDPQLIWIWNGDRDKIGGYRIYLNNTLLMSVGRHTSWLSIPEYEPSCGETYEFTVRAVNEGVSPSSNTVTWRGAQCSKIMRVTFEELDVHDPPEDEGGHRTPGPIYGGFWVAHGSEIDRLPFKASDCVGLGLFERCFGLKLHQGLYRVNDIFNWIRGWDDICSGGPGCPTPHFQVPDSNVVTFEVNQRDEVSFGGKIMDGDTNNPDDTLFEEQATWTLHTLEDDSIHTFYLNGEYVTLTVKYQLLPNEP